MLLPAEQIANTGEVCSTNVRQPLDVVMLDLLSIVPYYDAYLCREMMQIPGCRIRLAAITYHLDRQCYDRLGVCRAIPLDLVGKCRLAKIVRQPGKAAEYIFNLLSFTASLGRRRPDIIHVQYLPMLNKGYKWEIDLLRKWQRVGVRIVYTVHDLLPHDSGDRFRSAYREVYKTADELICHNEATRDRLIGEFGMSRDHISIIPHGPLFHDCVSTCSPELREHYGIHAHQKIILWQGIIHPYKGIDFLLDSWSALGRDDVVLVIAGTGNPTDIAALRSRIVALKLQSSVRFDTRFLPLAEMLALYKSAAVVVYPYKAITTSGALSTGIGQGKAIIATRLPAFEAILRQEENALLVNYGDRDALTRAIRSLVEDAALRASLEEGARRAASSNPSWRDIALRTEQCYRKVLGRGI